MLKYFLPLLCLLFFVGACANGARTSSPPCPKVFVAKPFERQILTDTVRDTQHTLVFDRVEVLCKEDKQGTTLLKLSFALHLDKPFVAKQGKKPLFLPLFAALTQDEKTVVSRHSKRLKTVFDKAGYAQTSWLVALPPSLLSSPEQVAASTLYLGFEGKQSLLSTLREQP